MSHACVRVLRDYYYTELCVKMVKLINVKRNNERMKTKEEEHLNTSTCDTHRNASNRAHASTIP